MFLKKILRPFSLIPIRLRLALIFVLIFGTLTIVFNAFLYQEMIRSLQNDFDNALYNYAVDVSKRIEIDNQGDVDFPPLRVDDGKIHPFPLGTALIQVRHRSGKVLARVGDFGSFNPPFKEAFKSIKKGNEVTYETIEAEFTNTIPKAEANDYRLINFPIERKKRPHFLLQITVPMTLLETQITNRLYLLQFGVPLILLIATIGGLFLSARALAPINQMIQAADNISAFQLSQRLPLPAAEDEIRKLTVTLNSMLDRIERAFLSQERFVADASHQLLTPMTIVRSEVEGMLKEASDNQKKTLQSALQEIDHLSSIVRKMLLLAKVDAGLDALNVQTIHLDEALVAAIARCEKISTAKEIGIKFDIGFHDTNEPQIIRGDIDLLTHLFSNLIENAIKYSPEKTMVTVNLQWSPDFSEVRIEDQGPGFSSEDIENLFSRFKRGSSSDHTIKGHGLGLAIARKIADLHQAELKAENGPQGAIFKFKMQNLV